MQFERVNKVLYSDTNLPDIFINEYMPNMTGEAIKVYITCIYFAKEVKSYRKEDVARFLSMDMKAFSETLTCLEGLNLISIKSEKINITDIKEIEINKLYTPRLTSAPTDAINNNDKDKKKNKVIAQINKSFFQGIMSPTWYYEVIDVIFARYKFDAEVMFSLFQYCYDNNSLNKNYVMKVAEGWSKGGVVNLSDLDRYLREFEAYKDIRIKILKKLKRRNMFTEYEEEYIKKWVNEYKYGFDVIEMALRKTVGKAEVSIKYINAILKNWFEEGVKKVEDIKEKKPIPPKKTDSNDNKRYEEDFYNNFYKTDKKDDE